MTGQAIEQAIQPSRGLAGDAGIGDAQSDADGRAIDLPLQPGGFLHRDLDAGIEAFPEARHRRHDRRLQLAQILRDGLRAFDIVADRAGIQGIIQADDAFGDVAHRQESQALIAGALVGEADAVDAVEQDIPMAEHGPLRWAGGAGRVDQDGGLLAGNARDAGFPVAWKGAIVRFAARQKGVETFADRVVEIAQAGHVEDDDAAEGRAGRLRFQRLVELFLVFHEDNRSAGIVQQIGNLGRGIGRVDAGGDAAGGENAEIGVDPFGNGFGQHRGDVTGREAERLQAHADMARLRGQLLPADFLPDAAILLAQDRGAALRLYPCQQHRGHTDPDPLILIGYAMAPVGAGPGSFAHAHRHSFFLFHRRPARTPSCFWPR